MDILLYTELEKYVSNKKISGSFKDMCNIYLYNSDSYKVHINKTDTQDIIVLNGFIVRETIYLITKDKNSKLYFTFSSYRHKGNHNYMGKTTLLHYDISFIMKQLFKLYDDHQIIMDKLIEYLNCDTC